MTSPPRPHHHGNLREALILAAFDLIRENGLSGLTLRQTAARAGVSHAAPAHHFAGLPGLLTAVSSRAFALFTETMQTASAATPPTPFAQLSAICEGYLTFAKQNAGLFQLMFATADLHHNDPDLMQNAQAAYQTLRQGCAPFCTADTAKNVETAVWSLVHGYALLRPSLEYDPDCPATSFQTLLQSLLKVDAVSQ